MNDRHIKVTIEFNPAPEVEEIRAALEAGRRVNFGFDVTVEDGSGSNRCDGLTWDEMIGQLVSIFPPRRRPFFQHVPFPPYPVEERSDTRGAGGIAPTEGGAP